MLKIVTVTKEHWDRGNDATAGGICETCVLAQAFLDAGFIAVRVYAEDAKLDGKNVKLPEAAIAVIDAFDGYPHRGVVPTFPVTFELEI